MKTFATDENNDIFLDRDRKISIVDGKAAILNVCKNVAQAILGEMIYAKRQGLPNFELIWNGKPNLSIWETILKSRLSNINGVLSIDEIMTIKNDDTLTYQASIITKYGSGTINGNI